MSSTKTTDPRYVASDDPRAILRAWGGEDATMDMGGWPDEDEDAFREAMQAESIRSAGEPLTHITIERVERAEDEGIIYCDGPYEVHPGATDDGEPDNTWVVVNSETGGVRCTFGDRDAAVREAQELNDPPSPEDE